MPYQIDPQAKASYTSRLKSVGFKDQQIENAFQMASGLVTSVLLGFANYVKVSPAEIDQIKIPGATPQQAEDFRKGAKYQIEQQNKIIEDALKNMGIDRAKDTR